MVLLGGKPVILDPPRSLPEDLNRQVYIIEATGEWFTEYTEYAKRLAILKANEYETELSGIKEIGYLEAAEDDERNLKYLMEKLPTHLAMPLTDFIYDLKEFDLVRLVEKCESFLSTHFVIDEFVKVIGHPDGDKIFKIVSKHTFDPVMDRKGKSIIIPSYTSFLITRTLTEKEIAAGNNDSSEQEENGNSEQLVVDQTQIMKVEKPLSRFILAMFCKLLYSHPNSKVINMLKHENIQLYATIRNWNDQFTNQDDRPIVIGDISNLPEKSIESENQDQPNSTEDDDLSKGAETNGNSESSISSSSNMENSIINENNKRPHDENDHTAAPSVPQQPPYETTLMQKLNISNPETFRLPTLKDLDTMSRKKYQPVPDLTLPSEGALNKFKNVKAYNKNWESIKVDDTNYILNDSPQLSRLLEIYCFLITFAPVIRINYFNFDDMLTSLKCTDSTELAGEIVSIKFKGVDEDQTIEKRSDTDTNESTPQIKSETTPTTITNDDIFTYKGKKVKITPSDWKRNPKIRKLIQERETEHLKYEIVFNINSTSNKFNVDEHPGTRLIIEIFTKLLSLIVDTNNDWRCDIVEEWYGTKDPEEVDPHMAKVLDTVLNYRGINWAQRLAKRQFENGNWLIILLGVLQDSMHISKYEKISNNFTKKIIPNPISVAQLHKQMFVNFCSKFTLDEKIDLLWVLTDIVLNFSKDISSWVTSTKRLENNILLEKMKIGRLHLAKRGTLGSLNLRLNNVKNGNNGIDNVEQVVTQLENSIQLITSQMNKIMEHEIYLDDKLNHLIDVRLKSLGFDKFGNQYYWLENDATVTDALMDKDNQKLYFSSRLWISGPPKAVMKTSFQIDDDSYNKWCAIAKERGKTIATREVFKIYQNEDGTFYKIEEDDVHIEIADANGVISDGYKLSLFERKIIEETPAKILMTSEESYFIDNIFDIRDYMATLNRLGINESSLQDNLMQMMNQYKQAMEIKEIQMGGDYYDSLERSLLNELARYEAVPKIEDENEFDKLHREMDEPKTLDLSNVDVGKLLDDGEELQNMAKELMYLHESGLSIKIYEQVSRLEKERLKIIETQLTILTQDLLGIRTELYSPHRNVNSAATEKLRKQMDILTDLLNYRHFKAIKRVAEWSNERNNFQLAEDLTVGDHFSQIWAAIQAKTAEVENFSAGPAI